MRRNTTDRHHKRSRPSSPAAKYRVEAPPTERPEAPAQPAPAPEVAEASPPKTLKVGAWDWIIETLETLESQVGRASLHHNVGELCYLAQQARGLRRAVRAKLPRPLRVTAYVGWPAQISIQARRTRHCLRMLRLMPDLTSSAMYAHLMSMRLAQVALHDLIDVRNMVLTVYDMIRAKPDTPEMIFRQARLGNTLQ